MPMRSKACVSSRFVGFSGVRIHVPTATFLLTLLVSAGMIFWVIQRVERRAAADGAVVAGWQQADTPPDSSSPDDPWLDLPDAWTEAAIPVADGVHVAADGGGDEALAAADGVVVFAGMRGGGRAVIVAHRAPDGARFESMYAPLDATSLVPGSLVGRGMVVGRYGEGVRTPVLREIPDGVGDAGPGPSPLAGALMSTDPRAWMSLEIGNAEKLIELLEEGED